MEDNQFVFTNETPYVIVEITPTQFLKITKFVSLNELTFVMAPSLGIKITSGGDQLDVRMFVSLMEGNQFNANVVETDLRYAVRKNTPMKIEIINEVPDRLFNIAMIYSIGPILYNSNA